MTAPPVAPELVVEIRAACRLFVPSVHRRPIGIVGAGGIVSAGHLPAYRAAGLEVAGLFDGRADAAGQVAARHAVPVVHRSLDDLIGDPGVSVVDIAVPAAHQPEIALRAIAAGKHVLCQKPFALRLCDAEAVVAAADAAGVLVAVNQQLRFEESVAAAVAMVERGWIGAVTEVLVDYRASTDMTQPDYVASEPHGATWYHAIHYIDLLCALLGRPDSAWAAAGWRGGRPSLSPLTRLTATVSFPRGIQALIHATHDAAADDTGIALRIEGTGGAMRCQLAWPGPSTLEVFGEPTHGRWWTYPARGTWLPDAFLGPMASLLEAIGTGARPATSGRDNLTTVSLVEAINRSVDSGEPQLLR